MAKYRKTPPTSTTRDPDPIPDPIPFGKPLAEVFAEPTPEPEASAPAPEPEPAPISTPTPPVPGLVVPACPYTPEQLLRLAQWEARGLPTPHWLRGDLAPARAALRAKGGR
jgi:hypothetical protein